MSLRDLPRGAMPARCRLCVALAGFVLGALALQATAQEIIRFPAKGQVPPGYPAQYAAIIAAAEQEGQLVIHSTTDIRIAAPLIDDFQALYPRIEVALSGHEQQRSLQRLPGRLARQSRRRPMSSGAPRWTCSFSLASAGQAQAYDSPEIAGLPAWALWKNVAFGTTFEPIAIVYNKRLLAPDEIPQTHADLARLLTEKRDRFAGKVVTYNIERSARGLPPRDPGRAGIARVLAAGQGAGRRRRASRADHRGDPDARRQGRRR